MSRARINQGTACRAPTRFLGLIAVTLSLIALSACAVVRSDTVTYIALLAPFEGRYREVGYELLYAARLALTDSGRTDLELLPVDDGGTVAAAAERAAALVRQPAVRVVLAAGYPAVSRATQTALDDLPLLVIGGWGAEPLRAATLILSSQDLTARLTVPPQPDVLDAAALPAPVIGGEVFALKQFPRLRETLDGVTVLSSAMVADADFTARYLASGEFVDPPGLLATLAYDATGMAIQAVSGADNRATVTERLRSMVYTGINGEFRFAGGWWQPAPIYAYRYGADGALELTE